MTTNLKALLVVLVLALPVFAIAKSLCLRFMTEGDFVRRRNVWLTLTITAFVSPSFWIYALVALPLMYWAGSKDRNPVALYVFLLHVISPVGLQIPAVIVNYIFELNNYRILAFAVLIPSAWRLYFSKEKAALGNHKWVDRFMWAYLLLQLVLLVPYEDFTNTVRRGFLFWLDSIVLVYVVSRACNSKQKLSEVLSLFCLACALAIPVAVFESQKVWLLYRGISDAWNIPTEIYLFRDGALRAQVATGHSLALGYMLAIAFGLWLYVSTRLESSFHRIAGSGAYWLGLIAAFSRAPWLTGGVAYIVYTLLNPDGLKKLFKAALIALPITAALLVSPIGPKIIDKLPFVGTVDAFNVEYRERLAESSWELIQKNPLFGDPFYARNLEHLRQGQGIIDMVNVYASIALLYGVVGLFLFLGPFAISLRAVHKLQRSSMRTDTDLSLLGASLTATMVATALFMATGSFSGALPKVFYLLVGLSAAYGQLKERKPN